ncbi:hypothetical protein ACFY3M_35195 [Streptomyces mirabilis]|uniref:hypothetical protein n=1 Tax=Streptomyces mirabilis TaxID=68239 RepID=UPI0036B83891
MQATLVDADAPPSGDDCHPGKAGHSPPTGQPSGTEGPVTADARQRTTRPARRAPGRG